MPAILNGTLFSRRRKIPKLPESWGHKWGEILVPAEMLTMPTQMQRRTPLEVVAMSSPPSQLRSPIWQPSVCLPWHPHRQHLEAMTPPRLYFLRRFWSPPKEAVSLWSLLLWGTLPPAERSSLNLSSLWTKQKQKQPLFLWSLIFFHGTSWSSGQSDSRVPNLKTTKEAIHFSDFLRTTITDLPPPKEKWCASSKEKENKIIQLNFHIVPH